MQSICVTFDSIERLASGNTNVTMILDMTPELVPGKMGKAISVSCAKPTEISSSLFGQDIRQTCFGDPELCPKGFTLAMWVYLETNIPGPTYVFSSGGQTSKSYGISILYDDDNRFHFHVRYKTGEKFTVNAEPTLNTWMHLAMTFDDGTLMVYINGELIGTDSDAEIIAPNLGNHNAVVLGCPNRGISLPADCQQHPTYCVEVLIDQLYFITEKLDVKAVRDLYVYPVQRQNTYHTVKANHKCAVNNTVIETTIIGCGLTCLSAKDCQGFNFFAIMGGLDGLCETFSVSQEGCSFIQADGWNVFFQIGGYVCT